MWKLVGSRSIIYLHTFDAKLLLWIKYYQFQRKLYLFFRIAIDISFQDITHRRWMYIVVTEPIIYMINQQIIFLFLLQNNLLMQKLHSDLAISWNDFEILFCATGLEVQIIQLKRNFIQFNKYHTQFYSQAMIQRKQTMYTNYKSSLHHGKRQPADLRRHFIEIIGACNLVTDRYLNAPFVSLCWSKLP